jgi:hypothetical protein
MSPVSGSGIEILFIGDDTWPEFADVAGWLMDQNVTAVNTVEAALARLQSDLKPALIAISQPWPGHVSSKQVESLRRAAPLARIVSLLGTWTEGEARTGSPWLAVPRVYWHAWLPRLATEVERLLTGEETAWSQPATAGFDEWVLNWYTPLPEAPSPRVPSPTTANIPQAKQIAVVTASRDTADSLGDICRTQGWVPTWQMSVTTATLSADLVLIDCRKLGPAVCQQLAEVRWQIANSEHHLPSPSSRAANPPIVALAGFPRLADCEKLKSLGVAAIVSKPFLASDLVRQIHHAWHVVRTSPA